MRSLYIIGASGFGTEVSHLVEIIQGVKKRWDKVYFIDDNKSLRDTLIRSIHVIGGLDFLESIDTEAEVVISINDIKVRKEIVERLKVKSNFIFPNLASPFAIIDSNNIKIGEGNIIMHNVILSTQLTIGDFNIFNSYTGIGHNCEIQHFNSFGPRVAISGNVRVGCCNAFGVNSTVIQNKIIGNNNSIWLCSSIVKNIKSDSTYFGNPAKKIDL